MLVILVLVATLGTAITGETLKAPRRPKRLVNTNPDTESTEFVEPAPLQLAGGIVLGPQIPSTGTAVVAYGAEFLGLTGNDRKIQWGVGVLQSASQQSLVGAYLTTASTLTLFTGRVGIGVDMNERVTLYFSGIGGFFFSTSGYSIATASSTTAVASPGNKGASLGAALSVDVKVAPRISVAGQIDTQTLITTSDSYNPSAVFGVSHILGTVRFWF
ncbi:MAG: hypothetical protein HYR96_16320 [Deltaproteobacteria bacterium]|nr:hypothetical protein [Deltaproteobacteria bacterium]MBI3296390.1 hypothetical protein [Deltaproteobacteria bacterium]